MRRYILHDKGKRGVWRPSPGRGFSLVLPWGEVMKDGVPGSAEPSCEQNRKPKRLLEMPTQCSWECGTDGPALECPSFSLFNFMSLLFVPLLISSAVPGSQTDPSQHNLNGEIPQNHHLPFNFGTPENMAQCSVRRHAWMNRCSQHVLPSWLPLSQVHHEWASRN